MGALLAVLLLVVLLVVLGVSELTKSRVEHVQRHAIALLGARDRHEPLIAIVLRFVDLDHTAADLPDLVDLLAALADNGADHVVRDEDLLG